MIVLLHVFIAVISIALATAACVTTSNSLRHVSYGFVGATLASGLYLVWSAPSHMLEACLSGVVYLTLASVLLIASRRRVAAVKEIVE